MLYKRKKKVIYSGLWRRYAIVAPLAAPKGYDDKLPLSRRPTRAVTIAGAESVFVAGFITCRNDGDAVESTVRHR